MLKIHNDEALTFDDILLEPKYSEIPSRLEVNLKSRLYKDVFLDIPIISANMDTVTESKMMTAMALLGGAGIIHRFNTPEQQLQEIQEYAKNLDSDFVFTEPIIISVGVNVDDAMDRVKRLYEYATIVDLEENIAVCIDVAHGHHKSVSNLIWKIKSYNHTIPVIAGNVCTYDGALFLARAGADAIKVGVGNGSICQTRIVAGCGTPQLQAIIEAKRAISDFICRDSRRPTLIADGGLKTSGDIVKALAAGADTVMLGSMLSGTDETPGQLIEVDGRNYKSYRGMASNAAMSSVGSRRKAPEGVSGLVPSKGPVADVVNNLTDGIRSGMSYLGCQSMFDLACTKISAKKITQNGRNESIPHISLGKGNIID